MHRYLIVTALAALTAACTVTSEFPSTPVSVPPTVATVPPAYCLALSGGGIRAGATALGVLQRLQELEILHEFSYVSSVSGGGYPVYGLLYEMTEKNGSLNDLLNEDGKYIERVERHSDFITFPALLTKLVVSTALIPMDQPVRLVERKPGRVMMSNGSAAYQANIHGTFTGRLIPMWGTPKLIEVQGLENKGFPYPIFLASAIDGSRAPAGKYPYSNRHLFELSPNWIGADAFGYWPNFRSDLTLENAISMSAAAVDAPDLPYDNIDAPLPKLLKKLSMGLGGYITLGDAQNVYLADGGFIENQALLPLVRRGCKTILSLDATSDAHASFRAVARVQDYLRSDGWTVTPLTPRGEVTLSEDQSGWNLPSHVWAFRAAKESLRSEVVVLKLGVARGRTYPEQVQAFLHSAWAGVPGKQPGCRSEGPWERCDFPLEATVRQSYSQEEFRAYRWLGKQLVDEWRATIPTDAPMKTGAR
jgi:hypothetical protein